MDFTTYITVVLWTFAILGLLWLHFQLLTYYGAVRGTVYDQWWLIPAALSCLSAVFLLFYKGIA